MERSEIRILVVEDDRAVRQIVIESLAQAGFAPDTAGCIHEACQKAVQQRYHLMFVNLVLPDGSGFDLLDRVCAGGVCSSIIIIAEQPSMSSAAQGVQRGVRDYLVKPINGREVVQAAESVLAADGLLIETDDRFLNELGRRLKAERQRANLTMRQLGARVHISQAQISQIEAGLSAPSLATLFRLARALKIRLSDLMKDF